MFRFRGTTLCIGEDADSRDSLPLATGVGDWRSWTARGVCIGNLMTRQHRDVVHWHGDVWAVERSSRANADLRPA